VYLLTFGDTYEAVLVIKSHQQKQFFSQGSDVILKFLLFHLPLSLVHLTVQVFLHVPGVATWFQK